MKLTRDIVLCIDMVGKLKQKTTPTKIEDLAKELNTTKHYLEQLHNKLRREGITDVKRGPGGGIMLKNQDPVAVLRIFKACGKSLTYNNETKEGKILEKVEQLLKSETC